MKTKIILSLFALTLPFTQAEAKSCSVGFSATEHEEAKDIAKFEINLNQGTDEVLPAAVVPGANITVQVSTIGTNTSQLWQNLMIRVLDTSDAANPKEITRAVTVVTNAKEVVFLSTGNGIFNANLSCF